MTIVGSSGRLGPPPPPRPRFARLRELRGRRLWVAAAAGVGLVAAAIFLATRSEERWSEPPLVEQPVETLESRWLHEADAWLAWVEDARLDPQRRAVQGCGKEFDKTVGVPPSERLDTFAELFRDACRTLSDSARYHLRAHANVDAELLDRAEEEEAEGLRLVALARTGLRSAGVRTSVARSRAVPRYSRVASALVGQPVEALCWSGRSWRRVIASVFEGTEEPLGFAAVFDPEGRIHLSPKACASLALIDRPEDQLSAAAVRRLASGIRVLAHEAEHSAGRFNEAVAECYAMQKVRSAARALGARPAFAARLALIVWVEIYPLEEGTYRSDRCRDGGPLDLRPKSHVWP
jgi:hypothetical protein